MSTPPRPREVAIVAYPCVQRMDFALALVEEDLDRDAALSIARHLVLFLRALGVGPAEYRRRFHPAGTALDAAAAA